MPRHARRDDPLAVVFHTDIGGGYDNPNPAARADPGLLLLGQFDGLIHPAPPVSQRLPSTPTAAATPESALLPPRPAPRRRPRRPYRRAQSRSTRHSGYHPGE